MDFFFGGWGGLAWFVVVVFCLVCGFVCGRLFDFFFQAWSERKKTSS